MIRSGKRMTAIACAVVVLTAAAGVGLALAREPRLARGSLGQAGVETAFTYQGQLTSGDHPVSDTCEMEFRLYDHADGGSQVGPTINTTVAITDGLFTVRLDFGGSAFQGDARWLGVMVQCPGDTGFTDLGRQEVTAAPYALYALGADWDGLTGVPSGFEDGVDDDTTYWAGTGLVTTGTTFSADEGYLQRRVTETCTSGSSMRAIYGDGTVACQLHSGQYYENVIVVAKSGGHFSSVQAALDSIADASADNRYLVWVGPGTYTETVTMKEYVDIEGAGELATKITYWGSASYFEATLVGASNAEIRFLTVENTGGQDYATAIYNLSASPRLSNLTARASGAAEDNVAVLNASSSPQMTYVTAIVSGTVGSRQDVAVVNSAGSSPTMTNVTATASGALGDVCGVWNIQNSSPTMLDVIATGSGSDADTFGVINFGGSSPVMTNVTARGSGGRISVGMLSQNSSPTITFSTATGGGATENYGIYDQGGGYTWTVTVNSSQIVGTSATVYGEASSTILLGASLLDGGPVTVAEGSVVCAGVYDEDYTFYPSTCP